jgi:hypothetical protein
MNWDHGNRPSFSGHQATVCSLLVVGLLGVVLLLSCGQESGPEAIADMMIEAFVEANIERAKAVTTPDQWAQIDDWMAGRTPFKCRGSGPMDPTGISGSVTFDADSGQWVGSLSYQCASERTPYCLDINDMVISQTEDGWRVTKWGAVCEAADFSYRCAELCR